MWLGNNAVCPEKFFSRQKSSASFLTCTVLNAHMHVTNAISHLSHATNAINAISHAINGISDECDKSDTYHTCDIASLIPRPHLLLGVRRIGDLNDAARAALTPLLGDDDAAVDCDSDVNDVAWPVLVTTINTTDGNAADPRGDVDGSKGGVVLPSQLCSLGETRQYVNDQVNHTRPDLLRYVNPGEYKVSISELMFRFLHKFWHTETPVMELR